MTLTYRREQLEGVAQEPSQKEQQVCAVEQIEGGDASPEERDRNCQESRVPATRHSGLILFAS